MVRPTFVYIALGTLLAITVALRPARAATRTYKVSMNGLSTTLPGQKFKFTGTGTMSIDDVNGQLTFTANLSNGTTLNGTGIAGNDKNLFGNIDFTQGPSHGIGIIIGKASSDKKTFSGKFTVGIPDRLSAAPNGFVTSTGTISGTQQ